MRKLARIRIITYVLIALFFIIAIFPVQRGNQISEKIMVSSVGIDEKDGNTIVTCESMSGTESELLNGEGVDLLGALESINKRYGKQAELEHCGLIIIDRKSVVEGKSVG